MRSLHELQAGFAEAVFDPRSTGFERHVRPNGSSGAGRLAIYRNNVTSTLSEALRVSYPVVERLVGSEFFAYAARCYIADFPSRSGDLRDYGAAFPALLRHLPGATGLVYLPDVARLEWACQEVFHAADSEPLDLGSLAAVPPERHDALRLRFHPASRFIEFGYPIFRIWEVNQPGYAGGRGVDLGQGGERLLVARRGIEIAIEPLGVGEHTLLQALAEDRTLASACESALAAEPRLDLAATLGAHIARRTIVGLSF
jgi:hypothetical protein